MNIAKKILVLILAVSVITSSGCKADIKTESGKPTDNNEISLNSNSAKISENSETVDKHFVSNKFLDDEYFYQINDVNCIDNKIYVSGYVLSNEHGSPTLIIKGMDGNVNYEYELGDEEQFCYFDDVVYTFEQDGDIIKEFNFTDANTLLCGTTDVSTYHISKIDMIYVKNNTMYIIDIDSNLHIVDSQNSHISINVSDYLKDSYRITADEQNNVYIWESDNNANVLYKFDNQLNLVYTCDNYSDMPGEVYDITYEDSLLKISTISDGMVYTNVIDESNGETLSREDDYEYNKTEDDSTANLAEDEELIGTSSDGGFVILRYPEIRDYYCTQIRDEKNAIAEELVFETESTKIISQTEICLNGDTVYIEETYDKREVLDENNGLSNHIIHRISDDKTHSSFTVASYNNEQYPLAIKSDREGNIYFVEQKDETFLISCYSPSGELIYSEEKNDILSFSDIVVVNDNIYLSYMTYDENYAVQEIDIDGKFKKELNNPLFAKVYTGNDEYDLFTCDRKKVYGYNFEKNEFTELLNLISCGIQNAPLDFIEYNDFWVYRDEQWYYLISTDEKSTTKQIIKIAGIEISDELKTQILNYNNSNDEYIIECMDYSSDEASCNRMNMDIIAGKSDMLVFNNYSSLAAENYNSFLFTDLSEYLSGDSEINEDEYFLNVIELFRGGNKLYAVTTEFNIYSMITTQESKKDKPLLLDDLFFDNAEINDYRFAYASDILSCYIDDRSFVNDDFRSVLKGLKENVVDTGNGFNLNFGFREFVEGSNMMYTGSLMTSCYGQKNKKTYYCGFPAKKGNGIVAESLESISILDNSNNKQGAWEFIKYCLSDDYQDQLYRGIPVKRSAYDKAFNEEKYVKEQCLNVIDKADVRYIGNTKLFNIIWEESEQYFNDLRSLDETIEVIKNKTKIYFSETDPVIF